MKMTTWHVLGAAGLALVLTASALAQQPQRVRVRGTIEKVDGNVMTIKSRDGATLTIKQGDNFRAQGLAKASLDDIPPDTFIGVTAMPQPDGSQKAIAIHIFTEQQRKVVPQGHTAWDLQPNSTMTNAVVGSKVTAAEGNVLTVKYKDGEKKIVVTPQTSIVKVVPADTSEVKPGTHVIIMGALKQPDGSLVTPNIYVGKDGIRPPM
jgi:outer membrane lipoprotein SlyB